MIRPGWSFLLSKKWAGYLAVAIVFALVCCLLGAWQLARRAEAAVEIHRVESNYDAAPVSLDELLPARDYWDDSLKWSRVELVGTYLADEELLVRSRPLGGQPGFEILTPLLTTDGSVFVVDRGWIPTGQRQDDPDVIPAPPEGEVTVVVHLKKSEPHIESRGAKEGQLATIELALIDEALEEDVVTGAYGLLESETPSSETGELSTRPIPDEGPHLSYALQWFVFALLGFIFLAYGARTEYRHVNADDPDEIEKANERQAKRAAKRTDADVEDEILDRGANAAH